LADVSKKTIFFSLAKAWAYSVETLCSLRISHLFPLLWMLYQLKWELLLDQHNSRLNLSKIFECSRMIQSWWYRKRVILHVHLHRWSLTFIVCISDGSKALLSSCIPNLKLDVFAITRNSLKTKVNSDCSHVVLVELVISETKE